jgi:hypothetical protein
MEMKTLVLTLSLATLLSAATVAAAHDDHHHHHHHHGDVADLELKHDEHGERWATDGPLRQGMDNILAAFEQAHGDFRDDGLDRQGAAALADEVEDQVRFIFANCALPADADAELHKLLAAILGAAATLREDDDVHAGLHQLHSALKIYGEYFDHPGWSA